MEVTKKDLFIFIVQTYSFLCCRQRRNDFSALRACRRRICRSIYNERQNHGVSIFRHAEQER